VSTEPDPARREHAQDDGGSAWERSRRPLVVQPPAFVPMTERDQQQVLDALVALLIPYLRSHTADAD
jgi:hypothetical protein